MNDIIVENHYKKLDYSIQKIEEYIEQVLQLEEVGCKDWLTNKLTDQLPADSRNNNVPVFFSCH